VFVNSVSRFTALNKRGYSRLPHLFRKTFEFLLRGGCNWKFVLVISRYNRKLWME